MDLRDLYQEVILDHNKRPRNFRAIEDGRKAEGYNPLCGDRVTVYVRVENGRVADASFQGSGCAISKASASLMTDIIKGKTLEEVEELFERFHQMITRPPDEPVEDLGKLSVLAGVRQLNQNRSRLRFGRSSFGANTEIQPSIANRVLGRRPVFPHNVRDACFRTAQ